MRSGRLRLGLGVLVALGAAGCAAPGQESVERPETTRAVVSVIDERVGTHSSADVAPAVEANGDVEPVDPTPPTTSTTGTTPEASTPAIDAGKVDSLLAELDSQLAGLDSLLNDAAAAMAAEEGEIVP